MKLLYSLVLSLAFTVFASADDQWITYEGKAGPGKGKRVVLLAGDEDYRSEEALPMLAKILSQRHGFTATVLFAIIPPHSPTPVPVLTVSGAAGAKAIS